MNAFVRQIAVLSVLWSLCELLLPDGRQQKMARMTVSILVMAALISAVSGLLGTQVQAVGLPALAQTVEEAGARSYARIALQAAANQTERFVISLARQAGYSARGARPYPAMAGAGAGHASPDGGRTAGASRRRTAQCAA